MKRLSMIAVLALLSSTVHAEVKLDFGGQAAFYYQTNNGGNNDFFDQKSSSANVGLQLNANADLDRGVNVGFQETFLGTLGLEKSIISDVRQYAQKNDKNGYALTKLFVSKKIDKSLVKLGRQELPKSLSPLAFSESWNVFKNTFDAAVVINKDLPNTTLVGAYVTKSNPSKGVNGFEDFSDLAGNSLALGNGGGVLRGDAYMLTVANESLKGLPVTVSYYALKDIANQESGQAVWFDAKSHHFPVHLALQAGEIDPSNNLSKTNAYGAKVSGNLMSSQLSLAYSSVNDGDVALQNVGTGVKTPLYTQMIGNQNFISRDNNTIVAKAITTLPIGKLITVYDHTNDNSTAKNDYQELDVVYKFKALGTNMLVAYIGQKTDNPTFAGENRANNLRFWTRYNF